MTAPTSTRVDPEELLRSRAVALAQSQTEEQVAGATDLLTALVAGRPISVPLESVAEVRPPSPVAEVPGSNAVLVGLVGGRGDALAVASLGVLLGLATEAPPHEQWVVVLHHPTAPLGLLVDTVQEIVRVGEHELTPATEAKGVVVAIAPDGALVLDTHALLRDPRVSLHPNDHTKEKSWRER